MSLALITAPTGEPLTVNDAVTKLQLRVDGADDDALIGLYIAAARRAAEHQTGRKLIAQTWELALDAFPAAEIELPLAPVASITSVKYLDSTAVLQTVASNQYTLDAASLPGWVIPAAGVSWPDTYPSANAVKVRFVAGWADAAAVPEDIMLWMLTHVAHWYKNREAVGEGNLQPLPYVDGLLDPHRIWRA